MFILIRLLILNCINYIAINSLFSQKLIIQKLTKLLLFYTGANPLLVVNPQCVAY